MTVLKPAPVSSSRFTYVPAQNMLVAEASDLPPLERVWDDACDVGLTVVSARTGREVVFALQYEAFQDGELRYQDFRPVDPRVWAAGTVRIFND